MANFANSDITDSGRILLADVQAGAVFIPTKIVMGSGAMPAGKTAATMTDVVTVVKILEINKHQKTPDGKVIFGGVYNNQDISSDFYFRELALYARAEYRDASGNVTRTVDERLYAYGNAGDTADHMTAYTTGAAVEKQLDLVVWVGNDTQVNLTIESALYIPQTEKGAAGGVATLGSDGKVPASQLPESPENNASNMTVTFTAAAERANISTGEKMSVLFGKIAKWFADLKKVAFTGKYSDLNNIPEAFPPANHEHSASDITSGTLPVKRGGTGVTSMDALASAIGAARIQTGSYTGTGAYGSSNKNSLTFDFVPKFVVITAKTGGAQYTTYAVNGSPFADMVISGNQYDLTTTWSGNTVSWYYGGGSSTSDVSDKQLNKSGEVYNYLAIG